MCLADPARVLTVTADGAAADVVVQGVVRTISLAPLTLDDRTPVVGEWVLVSMGMAIDRLDAAAAEQLQTFLDREGGP